MKALRIFDRIVDGARRAALCALLITIISLCTTNIVLRYLIKGISTLRPFPWVDELMRMGTIWVAFLAAGLGVREGSHVSLESITEKAFPPRVTKVLRKAALVIVLATLGALIYYGILTTIRQSRSFLQNIRISNGWFYAAIPVGCAYLFYEYLLILIFGAHPFRKKQAAGAGESAAKEETPC